MDKLVEKIGLAVLVCCSLSKTTLAQIKAVTETGEEVVLYDDGTWDYMRGMDTVTSEISTNPKIFERGDKATFLLKSSKLNVGVWLNPKQWSFKKAVSNPDAEYELQLKGDDLYGMMITEKMEIPLKTLREVALNNARSASPDIRIVNEEYRTVNGLKVLLLQMDGTMQGIKFSYYGYYYSDASGTLQFITYTAQNLMNEYKDESEALLNGLVEIK